MIEKTLEIHLNEQREEIAQKIAQAIDDLVPIPPIDSVELAFFNGLSIALDIVKNHSDSPTK